MIGHRCSPSAAVHVRMPIAGNQLIDAYLRVVMLSLLCAFLVAATFRTTGLDYPVYLAEFLDPVNDLSSREFGYVTLITLTGQVAGFWLVLLISNATFLVCHLTVLDRTRTVMQSIAFLIYLAFIGLFLIYGSPRRLIAFSLITYVIVTMAFRPEVAKDRFPQHALLVTVAFTFHASALAFFPILVAYAYGKALFKKIKNLALIISLISLGVWVLYVTGLIDYLTYKIMYYAVDAATDPDGYLADVPSVTSGLLKRFFALCLLWLGTRHVPMVRRPALDFCLIETFLYGILGSISPVLAVIATYFSVGYLLPILLVRTSSGAVTFSSLLLLCAAAVYYVPTIIGLIQLFGGIYVE